MTNLFKNIPLDGKTIFLIALASFTVIYIDARFIIQPQLAGIRNSQIAAAKFTKEIETFNQESRQAKVAERSYAQSRTASREEKGKKFITDDQILSLFAAVSDRAQENNVRIVQIRPVRDIGGVDKNQKITAFGIDLEMVCDYHSLGRFIASLEHSEVFMVVHSLTIAPEAGGAARQKTQLVVRTYVTK